VHTLTIEKLPPYNGTYDLDIGTFTGRELHTIKQISGVRAGELQDAFAAGDYDLVVALTVIVLQRAGQKVDADEIMDADVGSITIKLEEVAEDEERPPTSPPSNGNESSTVDGGNENAGTTSSGEPSSDAGDPLASPLRAIGSLS